MRSPSLNSGSYIPIQSGVIKGNDYMYKIFTPESWHSYFNHEPYLIIDDDGLIYTEDNYHKFIKNASGKIDYSTGLIYGEDYNHFFSTCIGRIVKNADVTEIYDDRISSTPVMYKKGDEIYSREEYFRLFGKPSAFVQNTQEPDHSYQARSTLSNSNTSASVSKSTTNNNASEDLDGLIGILVAIAVLVGAAEIAGVMRGSWDLIAVFLLEAAICAVVSLFTNKWTTIVLVADFISFCLVLCFDSSDILLALLLGPFLFTPPAVIFGTLFFLIRMAIEAFLESKKKRKQLEDDKETSEKVSTFFDHSQSGEFSKAVSVLDIKDPNSRFEIEIAFRRLAQLYHPNYGTNPSQSKYDEVVKSRDYLLEKLKG